MSEGGSPTHPKNPPDRARAGVRGLPSMVSTTIAVRGETSRKRGIAGSVGAPVLARCSARAMDRPCLQLARGSGA